MLWRINTEKDLGWKMLDQEAQTAFEYDAAISYFHLDLYMAKNQSLLLVQKKDASTSTGRRLLHHSFSQRVYS